MVWLTQSLRFIDLITNKGIALSAFLKITGLLIIPLSYIIIPIAVFISTAVLVYHFAYDRELVIFRTVGLSNFQISKPIIVFAALIMMLNYSISAYFLPKSYRDFKDLQEFFKNKYLSLFFEESVFNNQINHLTVYVEKKEDNKLYGIFIYDGKNPEKPVTIMAESGEIRRTPDGPQFLLVNGNHQEENKRNGTVSLTYFTSYRFNLSLFTDVPEARFMDANELYIHQLLDPLGFDEKLRGQEKEFYVHGHQRIIWPFYTVIVAMLGSGLLLNGFYNRRYFWAKNLIVSLAIAGVIISSLMVSNLALKNMGMVVVMYLTALFFFIFSIYCLRNNGEFRLITWAEKRLLDVFARKA